MFFFFFFQNVCVFPPSEPDEEEPIPDVATDIEVSEEDIDKSNEKKREAIHAYNDGKFEDAVNAYSEAIKLNPSK